MAALMRFGPLHMVLTALRESQRDRVPRLAAELSYYTVFSIAPSFIVIIAIVGLFVGHEAAQAQLFHFMRAIAGGGAADVIQLLVKGSQNAAHGGIATALATGATVLGAIGVFAQLKDALNIIWGAPERCFDLRRAIRDNALTFGLVVAFGFCSPSRSWSAQQWKR